ncbi:hypothetical protein BGZ81_004440 [Podila clonocystis]|nr:hypothetical protein BGZ81_004440 [Podila clonocystis]
MTATQAPHRGLRYYRVFLVVLGFVLLGLNTWTILKFNAARRDSSDSIPEHLLTEMYLTLLIPNATMIVMYLALAIGRPRLADQTRHSVLRVLFALALAASLIYSTADTINERIKREKYLRELGELNNIPSLKDYTFTSDYFCTRSDEFYSKRDGLLVYCQANVTVDMLYLISAALVLVELGFGLRVGELGKSEQKQ